jgi:histidinol-phosphate aminotransferase
VISPRREVAATPLAGHGGRLSLGGADVRHDFSTCLNAFGPAPEVSADVRRCTIDEYPDSGSRLARGAAAAAWGRPVEEIAFGAGAAELIQAVCLAYVRPGDRVLIATPAFGEYARAVALIGAEARFVPVDPRRPAWVGVDAVRAELVSTRPRLVFVAAPASPTGECISRHELRELADDCFAAGCLLVLDQAYDAFSAMPLGDPALPGHAVVVHLRSLTKDHALAGIRAAFAVAPADVIDAIERARIPWAASAPAQAAAVASFTESAAAHVARTTIVLRDEAARIAGRCAQIGFTPRPSATHYFVIEVGDAARVKSALLTKAGILVRDCTSFGLPSFIRVAARTPSENDALIEALESLPDALGSAMSPPHRLTSDANRHE